tara:strand:- start:1102 stop:1293 length:192 start_codon:yes stop_codon:yes gene_type:complete
MSKHIINSMRSLAPYLMEEEVVAPPKGLAGRVNTAPATGKVDPKQVIANYVSIIRKQRKSNGE